MFSETPNDGFIVFIFVLCPVSSVPTNSRPFSNGLMKNEWKNFNKTFSRKMRNNCVLRFSKKQKLQCSSPDKNMQTVFADMVTLYRNLNGLDATSNTRLYS